MKTRSVETRGSTDSGSSTLEAAAPKRLVPTRCQRPRDLWLPRYLGVRKRGVVEKPEGFAWKLLPRVRKCGVVERASLETVPKRGVVEGNCPKTRGCRKVFKDSHFDNPAFWDTAGPKPCKNPRFSKTLHSGTQEQPAAQRHPGRDITIGNGVKRAGLFSSLTVHHPGPGAMAWMRPPIRGSGSVLDRSRSMQPWP